MTCTTGILCHRMGVQSGHQTHTHNDDGMMILMMMLMIITGTDIYKYI